jgi:hypothetical protein
VQKIDIYTVNELCTSEHQHDVAFFSWLLWMVIAHSHCSYMLVSTASAPTADNAGWQ